jgi:hypothetical protein
MMAVTVNEIKRVSMSFTIKGTSPLIPHQWDEKAKEMMRQKHAGKKTKERAVRDPEAEAKAATYFTADGKYGLPGLALKASIIGAAHKDIGIEKTLVRKALFLVSDDPNCILPIESDEPIIREDMVRVGMGAADLRYRPQFNNWSVQVTFEVDAELLTNKDVIALVNRAGFGVGICEWRPEKGGEFGRFKIDETKPFVVTDL